MKKISLISICVLMLASLAVLQPVGRAATDAQLEAQIAETRRQKEALLIEQRRLEAELQAISSESRNLQGAVKTLDTTKAKLANDLRITQTNLNAANLTINRLTANISDTEREIGTHREAIASAIQGLSSYDSSSIILNILTQPSLSSIWVEQARLSELQGKLADAIISLKSARVVLEDTKNKKEVQKTTLVSLGNELSGQKKVVEANQAVKAQLLAQTKSKEAEYQRMLAENRAREEEFENQLTSYESQLKASDRSAIPAARKGVLSWPLDKIFVTQYFGYTAAARKLYPNSHHNGMDFRAAVGTRVLAVRGGVVKGMGNTDDQRGCYSYGRWILVEHDNGLSSLYAHLSAAIVSTGQVVTTGQVLGYSGGQPRAYGSGASTGPHLHLGLYSSQGVRIAQYLSSNNCKNVYIPLANPNDYLDPLPYF